MIIRIISILATVAALSGIAAPSFAADEEMTNPANSSVEAVSPAAPYCQPWMRNCRDHRPIFRNYACFARNSLGRTFVAYGNYRTPRYYVQFRALQECRNRSLPFIRATCRMIGCR